MVAANFLQINLNHSPGAQDLALQYMTEKNCGIGCFTELWRIPKRNANWLSSDGKRATIFCSSVELRKRCKAVASSGDWVAMAFGDIFIISCYLSPNEGINRFKRTLEELKNFIGNRSSKVLLCGDFNARLVSWGCRTADRRGTLFEEWVTELNLCIVNQGGTPT